MKTSSSLDIWIILLGWRIPWLLAAFAGNRWKKFSFGTPASRSLSSTPLLQVRTSEPLAIEEIDSFRSVVTVNIKSDRV